MRCKRLLSRAHRAEPSSSPARTTAARRAKQPRRHSNPSHGFSVTEARRRLGAGCACGLLGERSAVIPLRRVAVARLTLWNATSPRCHCPHSSSFSSRRYAPAFRERLAPRAGQKGAATRSTPADREAATHTPVLAVPAGSAVARDSACRLSLAPKTIRRVNGAARCRRPRLYAREDPDQPIRHAEPAQAPRPRCRALPAPRTPARMLLGAMHHVQAGGDRTRSASKLPV